VKKLCNRAVAVVVAAALLTQISAEIAAASPSAAEVDAHRREILRAMLKDDYQPSLIAGLRRTCALGGEPASVAESRTGGAYFTPDAADRCVTALVRTAHDGRLPELYRSLLAELGGSGEGYQKLPSVIGASVLKDVTKVAIGDGRAMVVTPALALDAGFTAAELEGAAGKAGTADARQMKTLAEACLGQKEDAGTCYSVGYMYGVQAFKARNAAVP
jgi:hypothetical protein